MAKKMSPKELRAKAKELVQAKLEEDKQYMKIGRLVEKELNKNEAFSSEDIGKIKVENGSLKREIYQIIKD